ncbi:MULTISPECIES: AI-2E family transporter [Clostridiaceae]|uniref:AI-2E family transporter n=1 Tax=Clostridium facile TaxID=2763035 RepID=A0ABR7ITJ1_9CLOT|nr:MULTISPECIES: AI-2E family transporter [Clostridiaceae]MBC5788398.1 AI-2E family transporter [Clostridium facile]
MKLKNHKYFSFGIMIFLTFAACVLFQKCIDTFEIGNFLQIIIGILMPFFVGFTIAYLLNPIVDFFEQKVFHRLFVKKDFKHKKTLIRVLALSISMIIAIAAFAGLLTLLLPQLLISIIGLFNNAPSYIREASDYFTSLLHDNPSIANFIDAQLEGIMTYIQQLSNAILPSLQKLLGNLTSGVIDFISVLKNMLVGIIISIYVLYSKERFIAQSKKVVVALFPSSFATSFINLIKETNTVFGGFIRGQIIDAIIVGILCTIGTSFIYKPYAILIGAIVGTTNVIPFFGPFIGAIPSAFLLLLIDPKKCLIFIIFIIALQQFDGNILVPKIVGDRTGLSAFWVVFAILAFGTLFGFVGMFIGVPVFAVIYTLVSRFINNRLSKKGFSINTADYLYMKGGKPPIKPAENSEESNPTNNAKADQ